MSNNKRIIYLDLIRIFACFLVIFNHTKEAGFLFFSQVPPFAFKSWISCILSIITRCNVPLFFLISGALVLNRDETIKKTLFRVLKYIIIIFLFSFILYIKNIIQGNETRDIISFLKYIYSNNYNYTYWFLYYYISFLLISPLLRSLVKNLDNKIFQYMFVVVLIFQASYFFSEAHFRFWLNASLNINWFYQEMIIFPFFGYYLHNRLDNDKTKKGLIHTSILSIICLILTAYFTILKIKNDGFVDENELVYYTHFRFIYAISIFLLFKQLFISKTFTDKATKIIGTISSLVLGVYLIHEPVLHSGPMYKILNVLLEIMPSSIIPSILISLITTIICGCIVFFLKKIPYINKLI